MNKIKTSIGKCSILIIIIFVLVFVISDKMFKKEFPQFKLKGEILSEYKYNPTNEFIFPTIIKAEEYLENPIGKYLIYYAPHDAPGGICMAYTNDLDGEWTEYNNNPVISIEEFNINSEKAHVSSPHIIWNDNTESFYMYYHGVGNDTIKVSESKDGINFKYINDVLSTKDIEDSIEVSYGRVFEKELPGKGNKYVMLLMANIEDGNVNGTLIGTRKIFKAWSNDGLKWEVDSEPLLDPLNNNKFNYGGNVSAPTMLEYRGKEYVIFHGSKIEGKENKDSDMYAIEVDENLNLKEELGEFYSSPLDNKYGTRDASPVFIKENGYLYMFYEGGSGRVNGKIIYAKSKLNKW